MNIPLSPLIIESDGLVAFHNQRCGVNTNEKAVLNTNTGIFHPCWAAQRNGYKLIKLNNWFDRLIFNIFFKEQ